MRLQLASDLHLEFLARMFPGQPTLAPSPHADALVLAGDIAKGVSAVELFRNWPVPVVYLAGNHEAYGSCWPDVVEQCARAAQGTAVHFLEQGVVEFGDVRILACTLWTDYCLLSRQRQDELMACANERLNDHRLIRKEDGTRFLAVDALREHERSRLWLASEIARPYAGKTVVATHHAPHPASVHPRYADEPLNGAFASDLTDLMAGVDLWVHGHVHDSFDYSVGRCRVVANPRGYPRNAGVARDMQDLAFENPSFQGDMLIDV